MATSPVRVGDKLRTPGRLGIDHYGIYVGARGGRTFGVVHNSKTQQQVVLEEWSAFCGGGPVYVVGHAVAGWEDFVADKALAYVGKAYNLLSFNCEHFANLVVDGQEVSPQLQRAARSTAVGATAGVVAVVTAAVVTGINIVADATIGGFRNARTGQFARAPLFRKPPRKRRRRRARRPGKR